MKNTLIKNADKIFADFPVVFAYLYGSCATGRSHTFSDLDIAVYIEMLLDITESRRLEMDIGLRIDSIYPEAPPSDIRIMNLLPIAVTGQIVTEGVLIYSRSEDAHVEYETLTRRRYFDFLPFIHKYQHDYFAQIEKGA